MISSDEEEVVTPPQEVMSEEQTESELTKILDPRFKVEGSSSEESKSDNEIPLPDIVSIDTIKKLIPDLLIRYITDMQSKNE